MSYSRYPIVNNTGGSAKTAVADTKLHDALEEVIRQLRINNTYNALGFDQEIKEQDL